ncbi:MAG: hypothetical protein RKE49_16015 [Oceanicaulis sp.]
MANLPTAYASQRFGAKALDFYAASGEVIGADPRARADERRLQDMDGARHTVRLMEAKFDLEPGDQASVLRLQPGPARRSRPVAVVNHTRGGWTRTHPGASALVSRAGIARNVNWALTMGLFALAALACVWPYLITFLAEIAPAAFAGVPAYDVFALAAAASPGLAGWSIAETTAPLAGLLAQIRPDLAGLAPALGYGAAAFAGAVMVFAARSWRLLWAPLFVAALGAGALGFGGASAALAPALAGLGVAALVFVLGGLWNRIGDAARLEARIALLADHLLSNAPEETVTGSGEEAETETHAEPESEAETAGAPDALVDERTAVAVAASLRSLDGDSSEEAQAEDTAEQSTEAGASDQADPGEDGAPEASMAEVLGVSEDAAEAEPTAGEPDAPKAADAEIPQPDGDTDRVSADGDTAAQPADPVDLSEADEVGEAARPDTPAPAGLEADEAERLRTDPRYASRAIILPPPPPMPAPSRNAAETEAPETPGAPGAPDANAPRELETAGAPAPAQTAARTLNPGKPLPDNVVPIFAAPPPDKD